jgi:hypothetical protein
MNTRLSSNGWRENDFDLAQFPADLVVIDRFAAGEADLVLVENAVRGELVML